MSTVERIRPSSHGHDIDGDAVQFRMVVFRPFKKEIMTGMVEKCTPEGIRRKFSNRCHARLNAADRVYQSRRASSKTSLCLLLCFLQVVYCEFR